MVTENTLVQHIFIVVAYKSAHSSSRAVGHTTSFSWKHWSRESAQAQQSGKELSFNNDVEYMWGSGPKVIGLASRCRYSVHELGRENSDHVELLREVCSEPWRQGMLGTFIDRQLTEFLHAVVCESCFSGLTVMELYTSSSGWRGSYFLHSYARPR
jgi:hypothetical protein